jgi:hypothetical protein
MNSLFFGSPLISGQAKETGYPNIIVKVFSPVKVKKF